MGKNKLFNLESKEEILKMKAIYRFIHDNNKTPEQIFSKYLTKKEKKELEKIDKNITFESIKSSMVGISKNKKK